MKILIVIICMLFSIVNVNASTGMSGERNITTFGCHLTDGTCYFTIDGAPVGPVECLNHSVRFNVLDSPNGKTWLSLLEIAYATNRKVNLKISGCYAQQPAFPTFSYGTIIK